MKIQRKILASVLLYAFAASPAFAQEAGDSSAKLAMQIQNPIASLTSVPFQLNYDSGLGPDGDGDKWLLNIQPVIPVSLNAEWNLISRTILPVIDQWDLDPGGVADASGIGDVVQSLFFSPKAPTASGWIWGAGPVFFLPTASDEFLGAEKWGAGPTIVALKQEHGWTYGALLNHIWSFAGDEDRNDVNATYMQPFVSYTTKTYTSFAINTESTYDWEAEEWSVPVNFLIGQLIKIGKLPVSLQVGARYWADSPPNGPEGWGARFQVSLLFPK